MKTSIGKIKKLTSDYLVFHSAMSRKENGRKTKRMIGVSDDKLVSLEVSGRSLKRLNKLQFMLFAGDGGLVHRIDYINAILRELGVMSVEVDTVNELEDGHKFINDNVTIERQNINNINVVFVTVV